MAAKRLLITTHYYPQHGGGVERVAGALAQALAARADVDVLWVASDDDPPPPASEHLHFRPARSWNGIERASGLPYPLWHPADVLRLWRAVGDADVVHIHDYLYAANLAVALMARLRGKPLIVTQHIGFVPYRSMLLRALLSTLNHVLGRWVLGSATQVVFISATVQQYFGRFVHFRRPPLLVANGVDTALFRPAGAAQRVSLRAGLGIVDERPILLFVGRFVEKKGLAIVEALARAFGSCQWLLVGRGPIDPASWQLPNVRVLGEIPQHELVPLYQAADLLLLPSKGEGFPLVVQEAMACGTLAMVGLETAAAWPGVAEHVISADAESRQAIPRWCEALAATLAAPKALAQRRAEVASFAQREWSWEDCAARYYSLLA